MEKVAFKDVQHYCRRDLLVGDEPAAGDRARRLPSLWDFRSDRLGKNRARWEPEHVLQRWW